MPKYVKVPLKCPYSLDEPQIVDLLYTVATDGNLLFAPFNGCDNLCGSAICSDCLARINNFLLSGTLTMDEVHSRLIQ